MNVDKPGSTFAGEVQQKLLHEVLKGSWGIGQPERHDFKFIQPLMGDECCLFVCFWGHTDLPVTCC